MQKKNGPNLHCWYNDVCTKSVLLGIVRRWAMLPVDLFVFFPNCEKRLLIIILSIWRMKVWCSLIDSLIQHASFKKIYGKESCLKKKVNYFS